MGSGAPEEARRGARLERSLTGCALAPRSASIPHRSTQPFKNRPDAATDSLHLRVEFWPPHDLHGRPFSFRSSGDGLSRIGTAYSIGRWEGNTLVVESNNFHGVDPNNPGAVGLPDTYLGVGWLDLHRGSPSIPEAMEAHRTISACELAADCWTLSSPSTIRRPT